MPILCFIAYMGNFRTLEFSHGGDTIPNRLIPFSILNNRTVTLDPFREQFEPKPWYLQEHKGSLVSLYPIGTPLAALPVYAPVYAFLAVGGRPSAELLFAVSQPAEKVSAALMTALAVWFFWLTLIRRLPPRQAFWFAIAFGLGTGMWGTASQILWQQTVVAASVTVALWFLTWPGLPGRAAAGAGAALSLAVATRPTAGLLLIAGLIAAIAMARQLWLPRALAFCAAAVPLIALSVSVNWYYYGHPSGFYNIFLGTILKAIFTKRGLAGAAGLLISPNRGLLIFTPIAILGILSLARQLVTRQGRDPVLLSFGIASLLHLLISGAYDVWWGGWSFGPRYLVDILPILALAAADLWNRLPAWARHLAVIALIWSILVQMNGAFCYPASGWNGRIPPTDPTASMWSWRDFELWQDLRAWWAQGNWSAPY